MSKLAHKKKYWEAANQMNEPKVKDMQTLQAIRDFKFVKPTAGLRVAYVAPKPLPIVSRIRSLATRVFVTLGHAFMRNDFEHETWRRIEFKNEHKEERNPIDIYRWY